jgi:hypothetical protein
LVDRRVLVGDTGRRKMGGFAVADEFCSVFPGRLCVVRVAAAASLALGCGCR